MATLTTPHYYSSTLTNVWELDAIILSYLSRDAIHRLTTIYDPPDPHTTEEDQHNQEHTLPDPATQDGLHVLANVLGAGTDHIHNHRIFLVIHILVTHILGIQFAPWRRSQQKKVRWDPLPPRKGDNYTALMDDISPYAQLLYPPSTRTDNGLRILSLSHITSPHGNNISSPRLRLLEPSHLDNLALLLGLDLPTPMYQLIVDVIVDHGKLHRTVPTAFALEHQEMATDEYAWNPTNNPAIGNERSYLASLDWIFYEVVSHRQDGKLGDKRPVTRGRGYYRALWAMASNATLMSHLWYSLVEEVASVYDREVDYVSVLSDKARSTLLDLVLAAWPQIEEVADAGEGTDYNVIVFDQLHLYLDLIEEEYVGTVGILLDLAISPITRCNGSRAESSDVMIGAYHPGDTALRMMSIPMYRVVDGYDMVDHDRDSDSEDRDGDDENEDDEY